jgi:L-amino acid N-acyltransferase YncA
LPQPAAVRYATSLGASEDSARRRFTNEKKRGIDLREGFTESDDPSMTNTNTKAWLKRGFSGHAIHSIDVL